MTLISVIKWLLCGYYIIDKERAILVQLLFKANIIRDLPLTDTGQTFYFDTKTQGFGVRVGMTKKAYFAESRVRGRKKRVTIGSTSQITLDTARKLARKALAEMAEGVDPNAEKVKAKVQGITLAEAAKAFFVGRDLRPKTKYDYERVLQRDFPDWLNIPLRTITPKNAVKRFDRVTVGSGKASANMSIRVFKAIWNYTRHDTADGEGYPILPECPANRITALKKMHANIRRQEYVKDYPAFFTALKTVSSIDFRLFFELLLRTGARRSEIAGLRWQDVDMENKAFTFRDTKNHLDHVLPMSTQLIDLFESLRGRHEGETYIWGTRPMGDPRKSLAAFRRAYGEPVKQHDLRRSFAVVAEACDISESKLKALLNHKDQSVTDGYLVSNNPERLRLEIQQISDRIDELA